jgi:hypothetical protein
MMSCLVCWFLVRGFSQQWRMVLSAIVGKRTKSFERVEVSYQLLKIKPAVKRLLLSFRPRQGLGIVARPVDRPYENYLLFRSHEARHCR